MERYEGEKIVVTNRGGRCIHSRHCVLERPEVFLANVDGPWIKPDAADASAVEATVLACPSGALGFERKDGAPGETAPPVNHLRLQENGPLAVRADLDIPGQDVGYRATLCRCGLSSKKPFCDNSHKARAFKATGEPVGKDSEPLAERGGPLKVTPTPNGPLMVEGSLEICAASGRTLDRTAKTFLCRCGHSMNKPYCDGSHKRVGFTAP